MTVTTTNPTATTVNGIISGTIYDVAVNAAYAAMVADLPILGLPIIGALFKTFLDWIAGYVYKYLSTLATFAVIDIQVASEESAYVTAEGALRTAMLSGDPVALAAAQAQFQLAVTHLVNYNGSAAT